MPRTRRTYTPEFKVEAVKFVTEQGYSVAEAAPSASARTCSATGSRPCRTRANTPVLGTLTSFVRLLQYSCLAGE